MNLCWGPELRQIYNDAYRVIMADKHPAGLGAPVLTSWAEIRDDIEVESPEAVDEFAEHFDARVVRTTSFIGRTDATSTASINGIQVRVSAHGYVSAVSA